MTEFVYNGVEVSEAEFQRLIDEGQDYLTNLEANIAKDYGVSEQTASAIVYLRSRSRWTPEKEQELVERNKAGNAILLMDVLSGEF